MELRQRYRKSQLSARKGADLSLSIQFYLHRAADELAEGAILFATLGEAGGVEGVLGLELTPAVESSWIETAVFDRGQEIGRASCRERVSTSV